MIFTTVILKEVKVMNNLQKQTQNFFEPWLAKLNNFYSHFFDLRGFKKDDQVYPSVHGNII